MSRAKIGARGLALAAGVSWAVALGCQGGARVSSREAPPGFDETIEQPFSSFIFDPEGKVYVGGQPSERALDEFAAIGGQIVVNLKTRGEMASLPEYEQLVESRGLDYHHLPTAEEELGPGSAEAFARVMAQLPEPRGPMLVHCRGSGRALYAIAMDQVRTGRMTPTEAIVWARARRRGVDWDRGVDAIRELGQEMERAGR